jgi:acyl CoA:acetate/3-ketoacid CoA transferase beta subunit
MSPEELIVARLLCELKKARRIALGTGLPRKVVPYLTTQQSWIDLGEGVSQSDTVDLALVQALEVSESGDAAVRFGTDVTSIQSKAWIALGILRDADASLRMVQKPTRPPQISRSVELIVTEMGVIRVTQIGFELLEVAPGVGSDDIRQKVRASLHVADDLRRIQLCEGVVD